MCCVLRIGCHHHAEHFSMRRMGCGLRRVAVSLAATDAAPSCTVEFDSIIPMTNIWLEFALRTTQWNFGVPRSVRRQHTHTHTHTAELLLFRGKAPGEEKIVFGAAYPPKIDFRVDTRRLTTTFTKSIHQKLTRDAAAFALFNFMFQTLPFHWRQTCSRYACNYKIKWFRLFWRIAHLPYTTCYRTGMMNTNKFIAGCCNVEVWLFLVHEKCIRYPDIFDKLWTNW